MLEQIITEDPFWRLSSDYFPRLNECASARNFRVQQRIFLKGSADADHFYLILAGTFVPGTSVITIRATGIGEALGWSCCFHPIGGISAHDPSMTSRSSRAPSHER